MEPKTTSWFMPIVTVVAVAASIILAFLGSGALGGTPINQAAGGALSADATPFAPAGPAFSIWSVIYLGLIGYAVYQLLPAQRAAARHRILRPWAAGSALLNAAWIGVVQAGSVAGSLAVILALLAVLVRILVVLSRTRPSTRTDTIFTDGTFGLYLGWVFVATIANAAALVATTGMSRFAGWEWAAVAVLVVIGAISVGLALATLGKIGPALAISWGVAWIAVARTSGDFESPILVWAAALTAAVVLLSTVFISITAARQRTKTSW